MRRRGRSPPGAPSPWPGRPGRASRARRGPPRTDRGRPRLGRDGPRRSSGRTARPSGRDRRAACSRRPPRRGGSAAGRRRAHRRGRPRRPARCRSRRRRRWRAQRAGPDRTAWTARASGAARPVPSSPSSPRMATIGMRPSPPPPSPAHDLGEQVPGGYEAKAGPRIHLVDGATDLVPGPADIRRDEVDPGEVEAEHRRRPLGQAQVGGVDSLQRERCRMPPRATLVMRRSRTNRPAAGTDSGPSPWRRAKCCASHSTRCSEACLPAPRRGSALSASRSRARDCTPSPLTPPGTRSIAQVTRPSMTNRR